MGRLRTGGAVATALLVLLCGSARAQDTVAMIVGGIDESAISAIEVFGCPNFEQDSVSLGILSSGLYFTAGTYYEEEGIVIICGGYSCQGATCAVSDSCTSYSAADGFQTFDQMGERKFNHKMGQVVDLDDSEERVSINFTM